MKKYFAEFIGTMVLVLFGCGSAAVAGGPLGTLGIALAFGLSIVAMAYVIGGVSGCHINPAVSFAMLLSKKMSGKDFVGYVVSQVLGGIVGILLLMLFIGQSAGGAAAAPDLAHLGQNGFGDASGVGLSMAGALVVEIVLTFVFVLTILGVTSSDKFGRVSGLVIGFTLAFVHIMGIPLTGTSVNPARSLAPAIFVGGEALSQVWVFIVAPLVGAALAALAWKLFRDKAEQAA